MVWRRVVIVFFALTCIFELFQFPLFAQGPLFRATLSLRYEDARTLLGFRGWNLATIEAALDRKLPPAQAVSLSPELRNDFLLQRFAEALFPRRIDFASPYLLSPGAGAALASPREGVSIFLAGPEATVPTGAPVAPSELDPPLASVAAGVLFLLVGAAALGGLALRFAGAARPGMGGAMLAGVVLVAMVATFATIAQVAVPLLAWPLAGAVALALALRRLCAVGITLELSPEGVAPALLALSLLASFALLPIFDWDARSIWFFRAKELYFQGYFPTADALRPEYSWAHPDYPLLLPGWLAYCNSFSPESFGERAGALGLAALFAALTACLWRAARNVFGARLGSALALALLLGVSPYVARATADGPLVLFLLVAYLLFRSERNEALAWCCLAGASLLKWEGLVFGLLIGAVMGKRRRGAALLLPSLAFLAWGRSLGLASDYRGVRVAEALADVGHRLAIILGSLPAVLGRSALLGAGAVSFLALVAVALRRRRAGAAMLICALSLAFVFAAFLFSPLDLQWHVDTAMGRLLVHAAAFSLVAMAETITPAL